MAVKKRKTLKQVWRHMIFRLTKFAVIFSLPMVALWLLVDPEPGSFVRLLLSLVCFIPSSIAATIFVLTYLIANSSKENKKEFVWYLIKGKALDPDTMEQELKDLLAEEIETEDRFKDFDY